MPDPLTIMALGSLIGSGGRALAGLGGGGSDMTGFGHQGESLREQNLHGTLESGQAHQRLVGALDHERPIRAPDLLTCQHRCNLVVVARIEDEELEINARALVGDA